MIHQQLVDYIKEQFAKGVDRTQIKSVLFSSGWQDADIEEAFGAVNNSGRPPLPPGPVTPHSPAALLPTSLPGVFNLLKEAWNIYKNRWKTFLGILFLPVLLALPIMILALLLFLFSTFLSGLGGLKILAVILAFIFTVAVIVGQLWAQVALLYALKDSAEGIGIKESFRRARPKIFSYLWISIISGFITMGGYFLGGIPGILFSIWFSFALFVLVNEDLRGLNALLKSKEYVRGRWWSVFWRFFGLGLLLAAIFLTIGLILRVFGQETANNLFSVVANIMQILLSPLLLAYGYLIYSHLKAEKGNFAFTPKNKGWFIFAGIIGILGIILILVLMTVILINPNSVQTKTTDLVRVVAGINQIRAEAEIIYSDNNSDYSGLCTAEHKLNITAHSNLDSIYKNIISRGAANLNEKCYAAAQKYCYQVSLQSDRAYCIDSAGNAGTSAVNCSGTSFSCE